MLHGDTPIPREAAPMAKTAAKTETVLRLKVTLRGVRPPVWRRLLVPRDMTLGDLHVAIQAAMGWGGGHLHVFDIAGREYGDPEHGIEDAENENRMTLKSVLASRVTRFTYLYDFGDNWEHQVAIEGAQPPLDGQSYPTCVAGKRNCPPDDCGGPWGYQDMLAVLADPTHPEHAEQVEWLGEDFDPEEFSTASVDAIIAAHFRRP